jgi:nitrate/nitrite transporter NarK
MALSTSLVLANYMDSNAAVIAMMTLAFFGKGLAAVGWAVLSDVAPKKMVGLCGGVFNGIGNVAGIVTPLVIGYVVASTGSFHNALWFMACWGSSLTCCWPDASSAPGRRRQTPWQQRPRETGAFLWPLKRGQTK